MLPLYEAKMIHHYDTRWATYEPDGSTRLMTAGEKAAHVPPMPRYWVHESEIEKKLDGRWEKPWFLGWRDICRATDERTFIATTLPMVAFGDPVLLVMPSTGRSELQSVWSSFVFDFVARQKAGGTHMKYFTTMQLPVPRPPAHADILDLGKRHDSWIRHRVESLTSWKVTGEARSWLRAELDAYCFHLYGVRRDDVSYIIETFPIVKAKDLKDFGAFRTKDLVLAAYDAMCEAIAQRAEYCSPFREEAPM